MLGSQSKTPWGLVLILFGAGILSAFQVGKVPPVLTDIRSDLTISLLYAGWILSIFNLTGLLLGTCAGAIADAVGHRKLMIAGFALQIAGCFLGSFARSFNGLLVTRILEGAGFLAVIVSTPTLIFQIVNPKDMKVALSVWSCYIPVGVSLMMVLLPFILAFTDWRGLWQFNAAILTVYSLLLSKKNRTYQIFEPDRSHQL